MILSVIAILIIILYLILIGALVYGFDTIEEFKLQDLPAQTKFSVVIPFRNEAEHLPKLLRSISNLNYQKSMFEIIFVDDASEDASVAIIEKYISKMASKKDFDSAKPIRIIKNKSNSNSPKKDAINSAIEISTSEWIITTDADCSLPKYWLDSFDECIQSKDSNCIVAPVSYHDSDSFFKRFQSLDILSLQGASIGAFGINQPFLCNGANFGYRKSVFEAVNGFNGNTTIASGDDIFLLEKFVKYNAKQVQHLKSSHAIVTTYPTETFTQLMQQRLRWASKTSRYNTWFAKAVGVLIFLANFVCITLIPLVLLNAITARTAIALFAIKFFIDFLLLFKTLRFFKQETLLLTYVVSSLIYPLFSVYIAFLTPFKSYEWKGRTFRK